jgi:hypothetical protein
MLTLPKSLKEKTKKEMLQPSWARKGSALTKYKSYFSFLFRKREKKKKQTFYFWQNEIL